MFPVNPGLTSAPLGTKRKYLLLPAFTLALKVTPGRALLSIEWVQVTKTSVLAVVWIVLESKLGILQTQIECSIVVVSFSVRGEKLARHDPYE